jgi:hypothetical protein
MERVGKCRLNVRRTGGNGNKERMMAAKGSGRANECGHPDRKHRAFGLCDQCYCALPVQRAKRKAYMMEYNSAPGFADRRKKYLETFYANSENRAKRKEYHSSPVARAARYEQETGISRHVSLSWFESPDRTCHFCHRIGATSLDHDHAAGVIRGWAHQVCNMAEGLVSGSPDPIALATSILRLRVALQAAEGSR